MKTIKVVAAVIRDRDKIFATQRGYGEFKGGWEFPGGKIEEGETPQEALKREIMEELDTEIEVGELIDTIEYDYPDFHLKYAGVGERELFSRRAMDEIFRISSGIPRLVNRICEKALMYGYQQGLRIIDDQDVLYVSDHEMLNGGEQL